MNENNVHEVESEIQREQLKVLKEVRDLLKHIRADQVKAQNTNHFKLTNDDAFKKEGHPYRW